MFVTTPKSKREVNGDFYFFFGSVFILCTVLELGRIYNLKLYGYYSEYSVFVGR